MEIKELEQRHAHSERIPVPSSNINVIQNIDMTVFNAYFLVVHVFKQQGECLNVSGYCVFD